MICHVAIRAMSRGAQRAMQIVAVSVASAKVSRKMRPSSQNWGPLRLRVGSEELIRPFSHNNRLNQGFFHPARRPSSKSQGLRELVLLSSNQLHGTLADDPAQSFGGALSWRRLAQQLRQLGELTAKCRASSPSRCVSRSPWRYIAVVRHPAASPSPTLAGAYFSRPASRTFVDDGTRPYTRRADRRRLPCFSRDVRPIPLIDY